MSARLRLLFSEAWRSLGANLSTTVAATMTVLISMFMLGLFIGFGGLAAALAQLIKPSATPAPVVVQAPPTQSAQASQPIVIYLSPPTQPK